MRSPMSGIDEQGTNSRLATERTMDLSTRITIEGLRRSECETLRQEIIKRIELGHRLISWTVAAAGAFVGLGGTITYRSRPVCDCVRGIQGSGWGICPMRSAPREPRVNSSTSFGRGEGYFAHRGANSLPDRDEGVTRWQTRRAAQFRTVRCDTGRPRSASNSNTRRLDSG